MNAKKPPLKLCLIAGTFLAPARFYRIKLVK